MRYFAAARDCGVFVTADRVTKLGQVFRYLQYLQIISTHYLQYLLSICTISTQDSQDPEQEEGVHEAASSVCDGSVTGGDVVTRDSRDMSRSVTATPTSR